MDHCVLALQNKFGYCYLIEGCEKLLVLDPLFNHKNNKYSKEEKLLTELSLGNPELKKIKKKKKKKEIETPYLLN